MIRFECDYNIGAHEKVIEAIVNTNEEQTCGYGLDEYCNEAKRLIKNKCEEDVDVHFVVGGTQANYIVISSALRAHEGVISADTGHINLHETGAVEAKGHKVIALESYDGKIKACDIDAYCGVHFTSDDMEHMVKPKMVYIYNPTEYGTIYKKEELLSIMKVCDKYDLYLFMDGARLGYGLVCEENDLTLKDISSICDVFYIGGTKVGALFGEAIVISNDKLKSDFRYFIKQNGAMLAKGRLLGIQFKALFEDDLYFNISKNAIKQIKKIKDALIKKGITMYIDSPTNQIFPIVNEKQLDYFENKVEFSYWEKVDKNNVIRFCTSFATTDKQTNELLKLIENMPN